MVVLDVGGADLGNLTLTLNFFEEAFVDDGACWGASQQRLLKVCGQQGNGCESLEGAEYHALEGDEAQ